MSKLASQNPVYIQQPKVNIIADVGGTNARFACVGNEGNYYQQVEIYACADFTTLSAAIAKYIASLKAELGTDLEIGQVCIAIAGPVYHDLVDLPNNHWNFSRTKLQKQSYANRSWYGFRSLNTNGCR